MKKRIIYTVFILGLGLNVFLGAHIYFLSVQAAEQNDPYQQYELFASVLEKLRNDYVDGDKLSYQELIHNALKGMLNSLDPHSEFMEPQKYTELKSDTQGEFGGIGIQIGLQENLITVIAPMDDTPAFRAGVLSGDRIVKIEGKSTENYNLNDVVKRLRGKPGTEVTITTLRPSTGAQRDLKLTRAIIRTSSVRDINGGREFPLNEDKIGYVRLAQFVEPTSDELETALKKLVSQGAKGLVLDLRGNPGGLLDQAVKVCEKFLPRNTPVVTTEGRTKEMKIEYLSKTRGAYRELPLAILVNRGSASASEIVAGCLQDLQRAYIIGTQTFGKGSVQSILPLQDGSALRLTTAKYYTPSHKVIHEKGITPDSTVPMTDEEAQAIFLQRSPGSMEGMDEEQRQRILKVRDVQLDRAVDWIKGINRALNMYSRRANGNGKLDGKSEN